MTYSCSSLVQTTTKYVSGVASSLVSTVTQKALPLASQCIQTTREKMTEISQAYLSAQANHPYASQTIGCVAGIATAVAVKKVAPVAIGKCTQIWNEHKIKRSYSILNGLTSSLEQKNQAAQWILNVSEESLKCLFEYEWSLKEIIKDERLDITTRTRAVDNWIGSYQNTIIRSRAFLCFYTTFGCTHNLSLQTRLLEGFLNILHNNQMVLARLLRPLYELTVLTRCNYSAMDISLRTKIIESLLLLSNKPDVPQLGKEEILSVLVDILVNEPEEILGAKVYHAFMEFPTSSDAEIHLKAYILKTILSITPNHYVITIEQKNQAAKMLLDLSMHPSLSATTTDTVAKGLGSIIGHKAIHPALRQAAITKIFELSTNHIGPQGLCIALSVIVNEELDATIQLHTKKRAIQILLQLLHSVNLPSVTRLDILDALSSSLDLSAKDLRPLQIRSAEAMVKFSKKNRVPLYKAICSKNMSFSFRDKALDQVISTLSHPKFFDDSFCDLFCIIRSETTEASLRLRAAKAILNPPSHSPINKIPRQNWSDALMNILSTVDFPVEMKASALKQLIEWASSRKTDEMQAAYILHGLCELVNPRGHGGPERHLEREWQYRVRAALQTVMRRRSDFRLWIEDMLRAERPSETGAMAHLAQNRQNVHQASVHLSIAESLKKLDAKYKELDEEALLEEMHDFVFNVAVPGNKTLTRNAKACFARLKEPSIAKTEESITHFTIQKILCLVWKGVTDPHKSPEDIQKNKLTFLRELQTIQNQYGPGHPSCMGGTMNQLTSILEGSDPDVQIVRLDSELLSDTYKELMVETFMQAPLPIQQALLKGEEQALTPFLEKMKSSFHTRVAGMNASIDERGIIFKKHIIMKIEEWNYLVSSEFLQEQLTISPALVRAIVEDIVKKNASSRSEEERKVLRDPKHALHKQTLAPFADLCRKEVLERLTRDFGASFSHSNGDLCYNGEPLIPGERFHTLLEEDEFRKAL